ncbi:MAG TPA: hypothetical protein VJ773_05635 [Gemmatimonadales bacterium]|nr:hypothetical protein [Gemmatimonadales bacterium]
MSPSELLRTVLAALDASDVPYMLTGSFAAAYHGRPRATQDLDFVVAPTAGRLGELTRRLVGAGFYVDEAAAQDALLHQAQFNAIHPGTGWKVDFIIRKSRPFSRAEFDRRREVRMEGLAFMVASVEDLILAKLEWARLGGSARQLEDAAALARFHRAELDLAYVRRWASALGIEREWEQAEAEGSLS